MSVTRRGRKGQGRRALTRDMLLPLAPAQVRALSLPLHLALVALKSGNGDREHIRLLAGVICRTDLMGQMSTKKFDGTFLVQADQVIQRLLHATGSAEPLVTTEEESETLARVLTIHDQQLQRSPRHYFYEAQQWLLDEASNLPQSELDSLPAWCRTQAVAV